MTHDVLLVAASFLACAVEMVEALTIVLAVGVTRGWRSAIIGPPPRSARSTVVVAALGPALAVLPIDGLRLFVGGLLLIFGLQWLRKAILRASGFKALHDEDAIFAEEQRAARAPRRRRVGHRLVHVHRVVQGRVPRRARGGVHRRHVRRRAAQRRAGRGRCRSPPRSSCSSSGSTVHRPLSQVPENTMKYAVGVMLTHVRDLLGRRRGRRRVAGQRRRAPRPARLRARHQRSCSSALLRRSRGTVELTGAVA